ncbi:MAG: histidine triad nucleotide-binding protein [bacterium]|nr:histidine triad nucleotide-binding protein [bacterium]
MSDIFCKIIAGEIPAEKIAETSDWVAIHDIHPKAPVHVLVIPKKHVELQDIDSALAGTLLVGVREVARKLEIDKAGFRVMINHGEHGGQEVPHLHLHLLGGKKL